MILIFAVALGIVCADQLTKWLAVIFLKDSASVPLIRDFFHFTYVENPGAAWGMFSNSRWVFMVFSTLAIAAILFYLIRFKPKSRLLRASLAMIVGGGIGNMIDRTVLGYVVDFIDFKLYYPNVSFRPFSIHAEMYDFPVFNVADTFVCVGAGLLILYLILDTIREARKEKKPAREENAQPETLPAEPDDGNVE